MTGGDLLPQGANTLIKTRGRLYGALSGLILILLLGGGSPLQAAQEATKQADARILIDISGSMRKNDPKNLRRPALRLLVGLMPADARAGVWTFGQYVNMLIPLGKIDATWKKKARAEAAKISSPGQFTNIEDVIKRSIADWEGPSDQYDRHLILLTDGVVDISKDQSKNSASRGRILQQLLPQLKANRARVHTIALSERADHELMKQLSRETDGWYEQVNSAEELQRIFLRIFEKVGRPDTLPLKDNKFLVDSSIQEVTLLVFRKEGAEPTRVVTPSGKTFDAKSAPGSVSWHRDVGYDLLTIAQPETGEWRVQAAMDPDNRVIVVTDLKMKSSTLPARFVQGESLPLSVSFTNQEKRITRQDFLDVVDLKSVPVDADGEGEPRPLLDDGTDGDEAANDGVFTFMVGEGLAAGKVELILTAQGKTFQRQARHTFELVEPIAVQVLPVSGGPQMRLTAVPDEEVVDAESLEFTAELISDKGDQQPIMLLPAADGRGMEAQIDPATLVGDWTLSLSVTGTTQAGSALNLSLEPAVIAGVAVAQAPEPEPEPAPQPEEPQMEASPPPEEIPDDSDDEFLTQMLMLGGVNLGIVMLVGLFLWLRHRSRRSTEFKVLEDEDLESDEDAPEEAAT